MSKNNKSQVEKAILTFIHLHNQIFGSPPSLRTIGPAVGISSTSHLSFLIKEMYQKGLIEYQELTSRTLQVTSLGQALLRGTYAFFTAPGKHTATYINHLACVSTSIPEPTITVPVLGHTVNDSLDGVFSSDLSLPVFDPENTLTVFYNGLLKRIQADSIYAIEVRGDSMVGIHIYDGDYMIIEQTNEADSGDLVIVYLPDESVPTLKFFYPEGDKIWLKPADYVYPTILVNSIGADTLRILGKVVQVVRLNN